MIGSDYSRKGNALPQLDFLIPIVGYENFICASVGCLRKHLPDKPGKKTYRRGSVLEAHSYGLRDVLAFSTEFDSENKECCKEMEAA